MRLWPHDPLTLWKKQRGLGSNPSSAPCWRGWMSSSCPQGFCLAMDNRNSTTDFRLLGGGAEECHRRQACDCVQRQGVAHRSGNPALGPFRCSPPSVPHAPISRNLQTPSAGGCGRPAGSHRRRLQRAGWSPGTRVVSRGDVGSSSVGSGLYVHATARGGSGGGTVPGPRNEEMPLGRTLPCPGSFVFQVVPFLPLFFVSWGPGTFPRPSPCRNHQIWSPSYEPGRLPAGQRLQNSWRLLKVSERCTAPPDLGAEGNYHSSFSFFSFSFFPRPFKFFVVVVVS